MVTVISQGRTGMGSHTGRRPEIQYPAIQMQVVPENLCPPAMKIRRPVSLSVRQGHVNRGKAKAAAGENQIGIQRFQRAAPVAFEFEPVGQGEGILDFMSQGEGVAEGAADGEPFPGEAELSGAQEQEQDCCAEENRGEKAAGAKDGEAHQEK